MTGPRVLVTGFEPFPGAPVNPTEWLVGRLQDAPPDIGGAGAFRAEMLPVAYGTVTERLTEIGRAFQPDIAVHFGLAQSCTGFRLERIARNRLLPVEADNLGFTPEAGPICAGPETLESSLPLQAIHDRLSAAALPVDWSDDAGGYLCNAVFTLSLARGAEAFHPTMSGFVHVPLLTENGSRTTSGAFEASMLLKGAGIILQTCVDVYIASNENGPVEPGHPS